MLPIQLLRVAHVVIHFGDKSYVYGSLKEECSYGMVLLASSGDLMGTLWWEVLISRNKT